MTALLPPPVPVAPAPPDEPVRRPIITVLDPGPHRRLIALTGPVALLGAVISRVAYDWVLWQAVALVLVVMAVPAAIVWRSTAARYGGTAALAAAVLTVQGLHSIEHLTQWIQRHILHEPMRRSNGLLSPANSEWVHFVWNWLVMFVVVLLVAKGMRSVWGWLLLAWALGHTLEHTYMFVRFLQVQSELGGLGVDGVTAQGLPGVVGAGGWLDLNGDGTTFEYICRIPIVTTADRVDAHFAWNTGEILLLLPAVHHLLRRLLPGG